MVQEDVSSPVLAHPNGVRRQGTCLEASLEVCPSLSTRAPCMDRFTLAADTQNLKSKVSHPQTAGFSLPVCGFTVIEFSGEK